MAEKQRLNVDVPRAVSDFADAAKEFELKEKLYRIVFRGKALEFESYRDFVPDDDASNIDWKASKRGNKLLVRRYREERDLNIFLVVDSGDNMVFGSTDKLKCEYTASLLAGLAHLIMGGNDKVGLIMYSDKIVKLIEPDRGEFHFNLLMDMLTSPGHYGSGSNIDLALEELLNYPNKLDAVIFLSDFLRLGQNESRKFIAIADRCECMAIMINDLLDRKLPEVSREVLIESPETGEQILVNPKVAKEIYLQKNLQHDKIVREIFKSANIDLLELTTNKWFPLPLAEFLEERVRRRGAFL
jgi:uncharacterized protein (DUF58 family)